MLKSSEKALGPFFFKKNKEIYVGEPLLKIRIIAHILGIVLLSRMFKKCLCVVTSQPTLVQVLSKKCMKPLTHQYKA